MGPATPEGRRPLPDRSGNTHLCLKPVYGKLCQVPLDSAPSGHQELKGSGEDTVPDIRPEVRCQVAAEASPNRPGRTPKVSLTRFDPLGVSGVLGVESLFLS